MKKPQRLLDSDATDFERSLLRAGQRERPSPSARRRSLAALGVGTAALSSSPAAAGAATTQLGSVVVAKWLGVVLVATGGIVGAVAALSTAARVDPVGSVHVVSRTERAPVAPSRGSAPSRELPAKPQPVMSPAAGVAPPSALASAPAPSTETGVAPVARSLDPSPLAVARSVSPRRTEAPDVVAASIRARPAARSGDDRSEKLANPAPAPVSAPSLEDEVASLDAARAAIAAGKGDEAARVLDQHEKRFASGVLSPEAMALRVEALARSGDHDRAAALGRRFLALYPTSPLGGRIRELIADVSNR